jgi:hypothetical protein
MSGGGKGCDITMYGNTGTMNIATTDVINIGSNGVNIITQGGCLNVGSSGGTDKNVNVYGYFRATQYLAQSGTVNIKDYAVKIESTQADITINYNKHNVVINSNTIIGSSSTSLTLTLSGQQMGGSQTITHKTNIINYDENQIGTFCETIGEVADVYGEDYTPTLDRATDAIVKVKQSTTF